MPTTRTQVPPLEAKGRVAAKLKRTALLSLGFPLIVIVGISPILLAMAAGLVCEMQGAELTEANAPDVPFGDLLYAVGVCGWFALGTIPLAMLALVGYLIYFAKTVMRLWRTHPKETPNGHKLV